MPRLPKKKTYVLSKEAERGRLDAIDQHDAKGLMWLPFKGKGKKRIIASLSQHIGKMIDKVNPLEIAAIGSIAFIVYNNIPEWISGLLNINRDQITNELGKVTIAYATAYIFVHHAGSIIGGAADVLSSLFDIFKWVVIGGAVSGGTVTTGTASAAFWIAPSAVPFVTLLPQLKEEWFEDGKIPVKVPNVGASG